MRASTWIMGILLLLAFVWLAMSFYTPPVVDAVAEWVGERRSGKAIIPPHLDERAIREKAARPGATLPNVP